MVRRRFALPVFAIALSTAAVSCSGSGSDSGSGVPAPGGSPAGAAASVARAASAGPSQNPSPSGPTQVTGTELATALLTTAQFPAGFADDPAAALDSGGSLTTAAAAHDPHHLTCAELANALGRPGFGESAMAGNGLSQDSTEQNFSEAVYQFASPGAADVFYEGLQATWSACHTIVAAITSNVTARFVVEPAAAPSGLGAQDFAVTESGSEGGVVNESITVIRDGDDVYLGFAGRLGGKQPTGIDSAALLRELMANVARLR